MITSCFHIHLVSKKCLSLAWKKCNSSLVIFFFNANYVMIYCMTVELHNGCLAFES